jgi:hypothetical protein
MASSSGVSHHIKTDIRPINSIIFHLNKSHSAYSLSSSFGGKSNGFIY